ncbi:MAG: protein BatD [Candidatus Mcinerneyibacterium aminivorans]|uniref:Protein BatD n=1 Tax=Candidatus Mcinerneyibacterium aminivorans TaxID=2703815 RepID=A0A5D0MG02_9BACT|nr:MAG: protein BatD [Candidatus Mcinerneyibacterium aminivorans]
MRKGETKMVQRHLKRIGSLAAVFLLVINFISAEIKVYSSVDSRSIRKNTAFRIVLNVELIDEKADFDEEKIEFPEIENLEIRGKFTSSSTQISIVNFDKKKKNIYKITYQLIYRGDKEKISIPPIKTEIGGKIYRTDPITLNVGGDKAATGISENDREFFITPLISRKELTEYEKFNVKYFMYVKPGNQIRNIAPDKKMHFDSYISVQKYDVMDELQKNQNVNFEKTVLKGIEYYRLKLYEYDLVPEKTGSINIPEFDFRIAYQKKRSGRGDDFFDSFMQNSRVKESIVSTESKKVRINPLPDSDFDNFSNIVCDNLRVENKISSKKAVTGEGLTYRIILKGNFLSSLASPPEFKNTDNWQVYEPEVVEIPGGVEYKYLIIPEKVGDIKLPSESIIYYDTGEKKYKKLQMRDYSIEVSAGEEFAAEEGENQGKKPFKTGNIHYIRDASEVVDKYNPVYRNWWYKAGVFICLVLIALRIFKDYREKKYFTDEEYRRMVESSKMAKKYKRKVKDLKHQEFYLFAFNFLQKYFSNKLNLKGNFPTKNQIIEAIKNKINSGKLHPETVESIKEIFEELEKGKFSPETAENKKYINKKISEIINIFESEV